MQERRPSILLTHTASAHQRLDDGDDHDDDVIMKVYMHFATEEAS